MHQNSPTVIADLKNFRGRNPRPPFLRGPLRGGRGKGRNGRWVGDERGEEGWRGREEGAEREGWVAGPLCEILNTPLTI